MSTNKLTAKGLDFSTLPELPQVAYLKTVVENLWQDQSLVAIWLGGSLARAEGDRFSDLDLRIGVKPKDLTKWEEVGLEPFFGAEVLAHHKLNFGTSVLHHLIAPNGDIYDLYIQSVAQDLSPEARIVFACRDEAFLAKLKTPASESSLTFPEAKAQDIAGMLEFYWLNAHKHRKGLDRGLHLLIWEGLNLFRPILLRLKFIELTGQDFGDLRRMTIHSMTPVIRTLQAASSSSFIDTVSMVTRTPDDLVAAITALNNDVSKLGRILASRYDFPYPENLETLVLRAWQEYVSTLNS